MRDSGVLVGEFAGSSRSISMFLTPAFPFFLQQAVRVNEGCHKDINCESLAAESPYPSWQRPFLHFTSPFRLKKNEKIIIYDSRFPFFFFSFSFPFLPSQ